MTAARSPASTAKRRRCVSSKPTRRPQSADEQAARARREAAEAESRSRAAERERETARGHAEHAAEIDPDAGSEGTDQPEGTRERPGRQ